MTSELSFARVAAIARQLKAGNLEKILAHGGDVQEIGMGQDIYVLRRGKILGNLGVAPGDADDDEHVEEAIVVCAAVLGGDEMFLSEDILGKYGNDIYQALQIHQFTRRGFELGTYRYDILPDHTLVWTLITTVETSVSERYWGLFKYGVDLQSSYSRLSTDERSRLVSTFACVRDYMPRVAQAQWCWRDGEIETRPEEFNHDVKLERTIRYLKSERKGGVLPQA